MTHQEDDFNTHVAMYLAKLYRIYPEKDALLPMDTGLSAEEVLGPERNHLAIDAAHWLLDKGYITGERDEMGVFFAVLSQRTWEFLKQPSGPDSEHSRGDVIADVAEGNRSPDRTEIIEEIMAALTGRA